MENEEYVFAVTAINQVGESMINASVMIQTNESCELCILKLLHYLYLLYSSQ